MRDLRLKVPHELNQETGRGLLDIVREETVEQGQTVVLDFSPTKDMDSLGGAWLIKIASEVKERGGTLSWQGEHDHVAAFLQMLQPGLVSQAASVVEQPGMLERLGGSTLSVAKEARQFMDLCIDAIYWTLLAPFEGRGFRWGTFVDEMHEMGVRAIRIVTLMNFLLGLIMAMLLSKQAESYGIQIFVADVLMIGFARELAAIMTATVVSARTGAAIAAEIATMKVQEELDALRGMGLNVTQFLVSPKLLALIIVQPCLVALGMVAGVVGGSIWGIFVLGFQPSVWFNQTLQAADLSDIVQGMLKTFFFAVAIVLIGCHNGFRVSGGSRGVGLMTTRAVVMDIFVIIVIDIIFAAVFYYALG